MFKKIDEKRKREILLRYKREKISLRKLGEEEGICWTTIWRWKKNNLCNKELEDIEEKVILLKEKHPELSLNKLKDLVLRQTGKKLSLKKLWKILHCEREHLSLKYLPNDYFKYRKKLDVYTKMNFYTLENHGVHFMELRKIRKYFEKHNLFFSAMKALLREIILLEWLGNPKEIIKISDRYREYFLKIKNSVMKFNFFISRAIAFALMGRIKESLNEIRICKKNRQIAKEYFISVTSSYYTFIEENNKFFEELKKLENKSQMRSNLTPLASFYVMSGEYDKALKLLNKMQIKNVIFYILKAYSYFFKGKINRVREEIQKAINTAEKGELKEYLFEAYFIGSLIDLLYNKKDKAEESLENLYRYLKKSKLNKKLITLSLLLNKGLNISDFDLFNSHKVIMILKGIEKGRRNFQYLKRFVEKKNIKGIFHRYILFYPDIAFNTIKKTGINFPRILFKFPLFNKDTLTIHLKLLGSLIIYRGEKRIKTKLEPKEKAFILFIAFKIPSPGRSININEIKHNFFRDSVNPSHNLRVYLYKIKRKLDIPTHLIEITEGEGRVLKNNGIYFTTDLTEFEDTCLKAKILLKDGNWNFAKEEFKRALKIFRGKPFEKMYDDFSDFQRIIILNKFEDETYRFLEEAMKRRDKKFKKLIKEKMQKVLNY